MRECRSQLQPKTERIELTQCDTAMRWIMSFVDLSYIKSFEVLVVENYKYRPYIQMCWLTKLLKGNA